MADLDPYKALGVGRDANDGAIKSAYRQLVKDLHPDLNPGDSSVTERLMDVNAAYDILSDPAKRADYDLSCFRRSAYSGEAGYPSFRQALRASLRPRYRPASELPSRGRSLLLSVWFLFFAALPLGVSYFAGLGILMKVLVWLITPISVSCSISTAVFAAFPQFRHQALLGLMTMIATGVLIYWVAFPLLAAR